MFVILDTNHYRELLHKTTSGERLAARIAGGNADVFTTVITVQEVTQGWVAEINRRTAGRDQVHAYRQFQSAILDFQEITILPFDSEAAEVFHSHTAAVRRIGTMDLKIASIAVSHEALLLTRNLSHFQQVPRLRVENWLD